MTVKSLEIHSLGIKKVAEWFIAKICYLHLCIELTIPWVRIPPFFSMCLNK